MKKTKNFLIGFLLLSALAFTSTVMAADFEMGVDEGEEATYEVLTVDEDKYETATGDEYNSTENGNKGEKSKVKLTALDVEDDKATLKIDIWDFTDGEFGEDRDDNYTISDIPLNEEDFTNTTLYFAFMRIIPTPVTNWLEAAESEAAEIFTANATIDGTVITLKGSNLMNQWEDEEGYQERTYNDKGILSSQKMVDSDDNVFYEITLVGEFIPGYELPLLLGMTGIFSVGLIYTIMKRK
ncbi:MAG: hypothetical protein ACOC35_16695 [Promethearchaeia archaeon]